MSGAKIIDHTNNKRIMDYQPIIGLEIHIELDTKSKMFCSCKNDPNERHPNVNICPICTAQPGSLPVINKEAIKKTIKTGLALNCQIPEYSQFDRKNYFYPDLPKGYQISQEYKPLCLEGFLEINGRKIRIKNVHLEEDTRLLAEKVGFTFIEQHHRVLPSMSFWRTIYYKKYPQVERVDKEFVLVFTKGYN